MFLGSLVCGGIWKGDILAADIEDLKNLDASEIHARRLSAKEVFMLKMVHDFFFPVADGKERI